MLHLPAGIVRLRESLLLPILLIASLSLAQVETATVSGQVSDPSGLNVSGARVTLVDIDRNTAIAATTNTSGLYTFASVHPGRYRMEVRADGFRVINFTGLTVNVQDHLEQNFRLEVGSVSESVTVTAGSELVNTTDATVSTVVDRQFAENLPLNGRSFQTLIDLTPGVVVAPSSATDPGQFSVNGQRTSSNYWMVDGVAANIGVPATASIANGAGMAGTVGSYSAMGGTNSLVSVDDLQEFRVQTSTYAPEFGRTPGAQISIVTRSGTDQFHGGVFDYFRNEALDANDWFADNSGVPKPPERQNDFGGTFGGPLFKGRTFFFFSYEGQRLKLPQVVETTVPCDATCTVAGNVRAEAQPVMQPYLNAFPLPNGPEVLSQPGTAELNASFGNSATLNAYSLRLDHKLKDKLSLFARYNYSPSNILTRGGPSGAFAPTLSQVNPSQIKLQTGTAGVTWMLSPTASDDFRFNYSRVATSNTSYVDNFGGAIPPSSYPLPDPYSVTDSLFQIFIFSLANPSFNVGSAEKNLQRQFNLVNSFSLLRGSHNLKIGIDYRILSPVTAPFSYAQSDSFLDIPSTLSAPPQLTGGYEVTSNNAAALLFHNLGAYAQDVWHANSRLTLTYGLRWDIDFTPTSTNGINLEGVTGFSTTNLSNLAMAAPGTPLFATDYSSLAPRIGVAYQLSQKPQRQVVVRGGFGAFYDLSTSEVGNSITEGYPFDNYTFGSATFPLNSTEAAPPPIIPPNATQGILDAFDPHLRAPRTLQWNLAVEQALGEQQTLTVSYIGARGSRLIETAEVFNPNANYNDADVIGNTASSNYNALQVQFKRRLSHGFQALASYTWSHSLDDASSGFGNSINTNSDNSGGAASNNYGPSDFDIRHVFSAALTYDVPVQRVHGFAKLILEGWSTENIIQAHSATPVNVFNGSFFELGPGYVLNVRPDAVPGQPFYLSGSQCSVLYHSQCPGGRGFNPAAFTNPPTTPSGCNPLVDFPCTPARQGNLGRNALRAFNMAQWDFAVHRNFPIHEILKLQFRAELFNVLNRPNFGPPDGDLIDSTFGVTTQMLGTSLANGNVGGGALSPLYQVGGPRSIQLALRLSF